MADHLTIFESKKVYSECCLGGSCAQKSIAWRWRDAAVIYFFVRLGWAAWYEGVAGTAIVRRRATDKRRPQLM